jgi:pilus assembly protein Flp/PilA
MGEAIRRRVGVFLRSEDGPTTTEYAVMFALILLICISTIRVVGTKVNSGFASATTGW